MTGEIGVGDYDALTFREVGLIIDGYNERILIQYRQTRLLMFMMARMWGDPKKSPKKPEELWPLPGDKTDAGMDKDEIAAMFARLREKDNETVKDGE